MIFPYTPKIISPAATAASTATGSVGSNSSSQFTRPNPLIPHFVKNGFVQAARLINGVGGLEPVEHCVQNDILF